MTAFDHNLREMPSFASLSDAELQVLASILKAEVYAAADEIFREGTLGRCCYFIVRGEVEIVKALPGGEQRVLATLHTHDVFGQISLIDAGPRSATARARSNVLTYRLERQDFDTLFSSGSRFALQFQLAVARAAASQLREANRRLAAVLDRGPAQGRNAQQARVLEEVQDLLARSDSHTPGTSRR